MEQAIKQKKPKWTPDQQKVIDYRNRDILVSAAAGSGKTATLVARIIKEITEGSNPYNIDELLIVTFTKAAAAEMKQRIGNAIEELRKEQPENEHLQKQSLLLHSAQISTIDSFCMYVLQNYFRDIDLDPVFRIADEDELTLLEHEAVEEVLEEFYEAGEEEFLTFSQNYGGKHQDVRLETYIRKLFHFSESCAWPEEWLKGLECKLEKESRLDDVPWIAELLSGAGQLIKDGIQILKRAMDICRDADGPQPYLAAIEDDYEYFCEMARCGTYEELSVLIRSYKPTALSRKSSACSEEKKELVKALREQTKSIVSSLQKDLFFQSFEMMREDMEKAIAPTRVLISLVLAFRQKFAQKKEEKNLLDFSDVEHFALNILVKRENGICTPRQAAIELRRQFAEIMIDEYQDSNDVQEAILRSISREEEKTPNVFMVGDVKQSIYRFRQAKPELFIDKYNRYTKEEGVYQRIDLKQNFRSRKEVLFGINEIFFRLMGNKFGKVNYDADSALYPGLPYENRSGEIIDNRSEILLITRDVDGEESGKKLEALAVAKQIKELVGSFTVSGKNGLRPCEYSDIVILLRTMSGWAEEYADVLASQNIPVTAKTQSGYFNVLEIKWLLNYLRIVDNPVQDIPLAGVLLSPFGGLNENDLAQIRAARRENMSLWDRVAAYVKGDKEDELKRKLEIFYQTLTDVRKQAALLSIVRLIEYIFERTAYDYYVEAMPAGEQRRQNLNAFLDRAAAFEKTSYSGLFQFIRYVEHLIQYDVDFGEADTGADKQNVVRIMSIHKSKGLEFPVVFVGGMTKNFNKMDLRERIVFHPECGIGLEYIDDVQRTKVSTIKKKAIQNRLNEEMLGEELRILYVALTRAREKLYMAGYTEDAKKSLNKYDLNCPDGNAMLSYLALSKGTCYLDYIGPIRNKLRYVKTRIVSASELLKNGEEKERETVISREDFLHPGGFPVSEEKRQSIQRAQNEILRHLEYQYPYEEEREIPIKTSVSEIKKRSYAEEEFVSNSLFDSPLLKKKEGEEDSCDTTGDSDAEKERMLPEFLKEGTIVRGTDRGTVYHYVLEQIPVKYSMTGDEVRKELEKLVVCGKITEEERAVVSVQKLVRFYGSDTAGRMEKAQTEGNLYKEQPFVLGIPACELYSINSREPVLVQGIIDVFWEEDGELVLLDYKTDAGGDNLEEILIHRYQTQLEIYARALTKITGKKVKESLIYSFALQRVIAVRPPGN